MRSVQIYLVLAGIVGSALTQFPDGVERCTYNGNNKEYNECIVQQIRAITPNLEKGIAAWKLPALNPYVLESLPIEATFQSARVKANFTNIEIFGLTNYLLKELDVNPKELDVHVKLTLPRVLVRGTYRVRGSVLFVPIYGYGQFYGNFTNIETEIKAKGGYAVDDNGVKRIVVSKLVPRTYVGDARIKLDAQGPASQVQAARTAMRVFNSNPRFILNMINPSIEQTLSSMVKTLMASVLSALRADEILP